MPGGGKFHIALSAAEATLPPPGAEDSRPVQSRPPTPDPWRGGGAPEPRAWGGAS